MERKLLIAVDDSLQSKHAVKYAGRLMAGDASVHFDLLNIQPAVSDFLVEEAKQAPAARRQLDQLLAKNADHSRDLLSQMGDVLSSCGVDADRISTHTLPRNLGVDKDILDFGLERRFDAIVLGRRGVSALQGILFGSVSNNVAQQSQVLPVWLVEGDTPPEKILVPVDGSVSSLRAVDHLAFIVNGRSDFRIVFLHVQPKLRQFCSIDFDDATAEPLEGLVAAGDARCIDHFYGKALHKLAEFDIGEDRIDIKTRSGLSSVGSQILKEAVDGGYDTVVLGRRGVNRSYFTGSVTQFVIGKAAERTLWIIP